MGYCRVDGDGTLSGPKKLARLKREGASRAVIQAEKADMRTRKMARKGAKLATGSRVQRAQFAALQRKVAAGTATRKQKRLVGGVIPTEVTAPAIERIARKRGGSDAAREALAAAAEAAAAAAAARESAAADAAQQREARAADAELARQQRDADREAERGIRDRDRQEAAELAAEERQLAIEEAEYQRELAQLSPANGGPSGGGLIYSGGGGGGLPSYRDPGTGEVVQRPGMDMGKILPIAAGAALLYLGS